MTGALVTAGALRQHRRPRAPRVVLEVLQAQRGTITATFELCGVGRAPAPAAMAATHTSSSSLE
eukprot:7475123-Pyramimonas_sp.AAC.1